MLVVEARFSVDSISKYKWYSVLRSTALVVTVLPIYLVEAHSLTVSEIIKYSSVFFLLPLVVEIPLGLLADRIGPTRVVIIGLIIFSGAFLSLIFASGVGSYLVYLLFITLASSCFSGAEDSILLNLVPKRDDLFSVKSDLNIFFYYTTSIVLLAGGVLYHLEPRLPFVLQAISILGAAWLVFTLPGRTEKSPSHRRPATIEALKSGSAQFLNSYRLAIIACMAVSTFIVGLNSRTVQIQLSDLLPFGQAIGVSAMFVAGNFVSAASLSCLKVYYSRCKTPIWPMVSLGIISFTSFSLLSTNTTAGVVLGFMALCAFKSGYRTYLSSQLLISLRDKGSTATVMSYVALTTAIVSALGSSIFSFYFSDFGTLNSYLALFMVAMFLIATSVIWNSRIEVIEVTPTNALSGKRHFIKREYNELTYIQRYQCQDHVNENITTLRYLEALYPSPNLVRQSDCELEWEFVAGDVLSLASKERQILALKTFSEIFARRLAVGGGLVHGDLHPDNILLADDGNVCVVDWDLCDYGNIVDDVLALYTSPRLKIDVEQRLEAISKLFNESVDDSRARAEEFVERKIDHLSNFGGEFIKSVCAGYVKIRKDFAIVR